MLNFNHFVDVFNTKFWSHSGIGKVMTFHSNVFGFFHYGYFGTVNPFTGNRG